MNKNFLKKLQNFIFQEKLLKQGDSVVVGISGGSDSIGLALALKKLQIKYALKLHLAHINYHQRGEASEEDEQFVRDFAGSNGLELTVIEYKEDATQAGNLEEQMRDFRYQKFEEIRKELKFDKIAVAHHLDDQAETFLMNLLRGSGLQGLTGMSAKRDFLIRPFLDVTKDEILEFLEEYNQKFRIDETNLKTDFTRNSIRLELIPFLEEKYNLNIKEGLGKLVANLQTENQLNQFCVDKIYADLVSILPRRTTDSKKSAEKVIWNISNINKVPAGALNGVFRKIILEFRGDLKDISNNNFREFKKIIESQKSKKQTMQIGKILLEKSGGCVIFNKVQ
jgi:tRNA(Ile)-lysidine synthase